MPGLVAPIADERDGLLGFLAQMRYVMRVCAHGLTDEQIRLRPSASALSIGGLLKHVARTEHAWSEMIQGRYVNDPAEYQTAFEIPEDATLASLLAAYDDVAAETGRVVAAVDDLGQSVPVPQGVPWFPDDVEAWSVRWVLLHLITETARHAGHADIVRESIDGATAFPLMAAAEGWPATPWMQPWQPAS
jgi:uncharacterized damage-inducible protein DinB